MSIEELCNQLLSDKTAHEIRIRLIRSDYATHVVTIFDAKENEIRKVLFNNQTGDIFKIIEIPKRKKKQLKVIDMAKLSELNRNQLVKVVSVAVRQCIYAHGPITTKWIGSAAKRITENFFGLHDIINYQNKSE